MSVDEKKLRNTTDAYVWAHEFCKAFATRVITQQSDGPDHIDPGTMIGWFANAIETGRIAGDAEVRAKLVVAENENHRWRGAARLTDEYIGESTDIPVIYWQDGWSLFDVWQAVKTEGGNL